MGRNGTSLIKNLLSVCASPLHLAARSGLKQAVQELLSRGANVQTVDENGRMKLVWGPGLAQALSRPQLHVCGHWSAWMVSSVPA